MIRAVNLLFIFLAQYLFRYSLELPILKYNNVLPALNHFEFFLLSLSTVLIAAAGYVINDYFDVKIDEINKPQRITIDRGINRRWAMALHIFLNFAGIFIGGFLAWKVNYIPLVGFHVFSAILLFFYSTTFKKKFLIGNIIVSILTGIVILIVPAYDLMVEKPIRGTGIILIVLTFATMYAAFAFIISMIREIIKDMEDVKGDADHDCKTMPVVIGVKYSKIIVAIIILTLIALIGILELKKLQHGDWILVLYAVFFIQLPLILCLAKLKNADTPKDFAQLSLLIKLIMLTGILSMIVIYYFENPALFFTA